RLGVRVPERRADSRSGRAGEPAASLAGLKIYGEASQVITFPEASYTRVACVRPSTQYVRLAAFFFLPPLTTATPDAFVVAEAVLVNGRPSAIPLNVPLTVAP